MSEQEKGKGEDLQDLPLPMAKQKTKGTRKGCPDAQPSTKHVGCTGHASTCASKPLV